MTGWWNTMVNKWASRSASPDVGDGYYFFIMLSPYTPVRRFARPSVCVRWWSPGDLLCSAPVSSLQPVARFPKLYDLTYGPPNSRFRVYKIMWNGRDRRNTSICGIPTTITLTNTASNDYAEQCCWGWLFCIYCRTDSLSDGPTTSYASHRWSSLYLQFTKNKIVERLMKYENNTQTKELQQTSSKQLAIFTERVVNVWNSLPNTTDFNSLAVLLNV